MTDAKSPAEQWYFGDWKRDLELQSCSLAARGLWMELLGMMHFATPRGYLRTAAGPIPDHRLAAMVSAGPAENVLVLLAELEAAKVFSRDQDGAIYNRRMVRQAEISQKRVLAGRLGGFAKAKRLAKSWHTTVEADAEAGVSAVAVEVVGESSSTRPPARDGVSRNSGAPEPALPAYLEALRAHHPRFSEELDVARALFEVEKLLPPLDSFTATLRAWAASEQWTEEGGRYAPKAAKWVRGGGFTSPPPPPSGSPRRGGSATPVLALTDDQRSALRRRRGLPYDAERGGYVRADGSLAATPDGAHA